MNFKNDDFQKSYTHITSFRMQTVLNNNTLFSLVMLVLRLPSPSDIYLFFFTTFWDSNPILNNLTNKPVQALNKWGWVTDQVWSLKRGSLIRVAIDCLRQGDWCWGRWGGIDPSYFQQLPPLWHQDRVFLWNGTETLFSCCPHWPAAPLLRPNFFTLFPPLYFSSIDPNWQWSFWTQHLHPWTMP